MHRMYVNIILTHIYICIYIYKYYIYDYIYIILYLYLYLYLMIPISASLYLFLYGTIYIYNYIYMVLSDGVSRNFNICQTTPGSPRRTRPKPTWALDQNQGTTERAARNHL